MVYFAQCFQNVLFFSLFVVSGSVHIHYLSMNGHLRLIPCIKFKVDSYTGVNAHTMNWGSIEIRALRPHSEVVRAAHSSFSRVFVNVSWTTLKGHLCISGSKSHPTVLIWADFIVLLHYRFPVSLSFLYVISNGTAFEVVVFLPQLSQTAVLVLV